MLPPTFLGFRGRWNITHWTYSLQGCMGERKGDLKRTPTTTRDWVLALACPSPAL